MEDIMLNQSKTEKPSIIGMFHRPVEQFKRIKLQPLIWGGLIVILVLSLISGIMASFYTDEALTNELGDFTEQQTQLMLLFTKISTVIAAIISPIIALFIKALVLLIIAKIVQAAVSFKQLLSMSIYIAVIGAIGGLINTSVLLASGASDVTMIATSLASVITVKGALAGLFMNIEIFNIWMLILTAIGMQVVIGVSKKVSWILVVSYFIITTLIMMGSMFILDALDAFV